jgi:peptidoglycan/LPS O-acetylase OafA/YrhL
MAKQRYEVLDGLRGTAALSVVALHMCEVFRPTAAGNPMHHAYLAVDFFYMLSGFVIGHAYDGRWGRMTVAGFFGQRLRRLHPLVVLGVVFGVHAYIVERVLLHGAAAPIGRLALDVGLALLLLPQPSLPGREGQTFSVDGPAWSLGQEYLANIVYALVGPRLGRRTLALLAAVSGAALVVLGMTHGWLHLGWSWTTLMWAPVRTAFPFFMGLLLQRSGAALRVPGGWVALSLILLAAFCAPVLPQPAANGLFDAAMVIGVFPLVIAIGAGSAAARRTRGLCNLAGEISYPLYILHYPLVRLYAAWTATTAAPHAAQLAVGAALAAALPVIAWVALRTYDEPLRAWFGRVRRPARVLPEAPAAPKASPG